MRLLREWIHRLVGTFSGRRGDAELEQELRLHLELAAEDARRRGADPDEAMRAARIDAGAITQAIESVREQRAIPLLEDLARDVRHAIGTLGRHGGFTIVAVLTLALGIGANTAVFSLIDALMLRWLPVRDPQQLALVALESRGARDPGSPTLSYPILRALDDRREVLAGAAGFTSTTFDVGAPGSLVRVPGAVVTGAFYDTLGLRPALGRLIRREDDRRGAPAVAVISYDYWQREFAGSPAIVGQPLFMHVPVTIVGVGPPGFTGATVGAAAEITIAVAMLPDIDPQAAPLLGPGNFWLRAIARPAAGLPRAQAQARLNAVWPQIADRVISPAWPSPRRQAIRHAVFRLSSGATGWTYLRQIYERPLLVLMAMVALVLLIACANVACLLLAAGTARTREIAVRLALGATRARIVRQLLVESALLSVLGAAIAVVLAWGSGRAFVALISTGPVSLVVDTAPNWHVLAFSAAVAFTTTMLFGIAPAVRATATTPVSALRQDGARGPRARGLSALVAAQVALSLVLLVAAGLFVRTLQNLRSVDPGFRRDGVLLVDVSGQDARQVASLVDELRTIPGVGAASASTHTPLSGATWSEPAVPAGQPLPDRDTALFVGAAPEFFDTLGMRMLAGRDFTERDSSTAPAVAVVNEAFARQSFSDAPPIGRYLSASVRGQRKDLEIIGVVANTSATGLRTAPPATVYVPLAQVSGSRQATLETRVDRDMAGVAAAVRRRLAPRLPRQLIDVRPLSAQVDATIVQDRLMAALAAAFGVLALMLASIGLYGVVAYTVTCRTHEIGIRMALGSGRRHVIRDVLAGAARPVVAGAAVGLPIAWIASRSVRLMLFGLQPSDPLVIVAAVVLLIGAALLAAYLPAHRAARVDPLVALRHE